MKQLLLVILLITLVGCVTVDEQTQSCDPKKRETVFASKKIEVNKALKANHATRLVVKSYREPTIVRVPDQHEILLKGVEDFSVKGYHTNECIAEKTRKNITSAKASVGYTVERKNESIYVSTTNEWRYIHHQTAFESIEITLPEGMTYQYIHTPLQRRDRG